VWNTKWYFIFKTLYGYLRCTWHIYICLC
jgi:hypothetical protein